MPKDLFECLLEAFIESLGVFVFVFFLYLIFGFVEELIERKHKKQVIGPLQGSLFGLIPQCGVSVAFSELYLQRKITIGTLIAIFISCSDEALFLLLSSPKALSAIPLLLAKFVFGFLAGIFVDYIFVSKKIDEEIDVEVCNHLHEHHHEEKKLIKILKHTLHHALEVFLYVLGVNLVFAVILYFSNDSLERFLIANKFATPLYAALVGLVPNCASSVVITKLYLMESISFGALLSGLSSNAGLGVIYLFKKKGNLKVKIAIIVTLFSLSVLIGYLTSFIIGF